MEKIQILGPGCPRCAQLAAHAEQAVRELGAAYEIEKVTGATEIANFGVVLTPAMVVGGRIAVAGQVPPVAKIKELLKPQTT